MDNSSQFMPESNISSTSNSLFGQVYLDSNSPDQDQLFSNNSNTNSMMATSVNQNSSTSIFDQPETQPSPQTSIEHPSNNSIFNPTTQPKSKPTSSLFDPIIPVKSEQISPKSLFDPINNDRTTSNTTTNSETSSFMQMTRPLPSSEKISRETSPPNDNGSNFETGNFETASNFQHNQQGFQDPNDWTNQSNNFGAPPSLPKPSWDANVKIPSATPWGESPSQKSPEVSVFGNFNPVPPDVDQKLDMKSMFEKHVPKNDFKTDFAPFKNDPQTDSKNEVEPTKPVIIKRIAPTTSNIYELLNSRKNKDGKPPNFTNAPAVNANFVPNFQKQNSSEYKPSSSFHRQNSSEYNSNSRIGPKFSDSKDGSSREHGSRDYGSKFSESKERGDYASKYAEAKDYGSKFNEKKGEAGAFQVGTPEDKKTGKRGPDGKPEEMPKFAKSDDEKFNHEIDPKFLREGMKCYDYKALMEIAKKPSCQRVPVSQYEKIDFSNKKYLCPRSEKWDPRLFLHAERQRRFPELFEKERIEKEQAASSRHLAEAIKNAQSDAAKDDKKVSDSPNSDGKEQDQLVPEVIELDAAVIELDAKVVTSKENNESVENIIQNTSQADNNQITGQANNSQNNSQNNNQTNSRNISQINVKNASDFTQNNGKTTPVQNNNLQQPSNQAQNSGLSSSPSTRPRGNSGTLHRQPQGPMDTQSAIMKLCKERSDRAAKKGTGSESIGFNNIRTTTEPEPTRVQATPSPAAKTNLPPTFGGMRADSPSETGETQLHGSNRQLRASGNDKGMGERKGFDFGNKADQSRGNACFDDWKSARTRKWKETTETNDDVKMMENDGVAKDPAFQNETQRQPQQPMQTVPVQNMQNVNERKFVQKMEFGKNDSDWGSPKPSKNDEWGNQKLSKNEFKNEYKVDKNDGKSEMNKNEYKTDKYNQNYKNPSNQYKQQYNAPAFEPIQPTTAPPVQKTKFDLFEEIKRRKQNAAQKEQAKEGNVDGLATLKSGVDNYNANDNYKATKAEINQKHSAPKYSMQNSESSKMKSVTEIKEFKPQSKPEKSIPQKSLKIKTFAELQGLNEAAPSNQQKIQQNNSNQPQKSNQSQPQKSNQFQQPKPSKKTSKLPEWADDDDNDFDTGFFLEGLPDDFRVDPAVQSTTLNIVMGFC
jgi:hypothetical protein